MLSQLRFSGIASSVRDAFIVNAILNPHAFDLDEAPPRASGAPSIEGDGVWPGQWDVQDVDVVFTPYAFRAIRTVAGCEDFELKDRLRHEEFMLDHVFPANARGQVIQQALMCDPDTSTFFFVRFYQGWHDDGAPMMGVLGIWPATFRLNVALRQGAARMVMPPSQYDRWLAEGEPTMRDLPRLRLWFSDWNASPDHPIRMDDLLGAKDRIDVHLISAQGRDLMVGYLPLALRRMSRRRLVEQELFWNWIDERMADLRDRGLMGDNEMSLEEVQSISMRNTRGLPSPDGAKTDPVLCFEAWRRA